MLSPDKQKKLKRLETLAKVIDNGDVAILEHVDSLEDKLEELEKQIPDVRSALDRVEALVDGEKGDKGDDYVLTSEDKKEIASLIKVPVVEKVIERTEVVKEQPIVTKEIVKEVREVKVDVPFVDDASISYLEEKIVSLKEKLEDKIDNLPKATLPSPIGIVVREVQAGAGVSIDNSNPLKPIISSTEGVTTWSYYATTWSVEPTLNSSITGGDVYDYTLNGTTRYRFVPDPYDPTQDAFYSTFSAGVLSDIIVTRG